MSFESTIAQTESQVTDLPEYAEYLSSLGIAPMDPQQCLFVGAGDSLAVACFAERLSGYRARAFDPYDLMENPELAKEKSVYIISVSGKTRANIEAAASAGPFAKEVVAITANDQSPLAKDASRVLRLKFSKKSSGLTPGTNSFACSLLAVSFLLGPREPKLDISKMIEEAQRMVRSVPKPSRSVHFVGSGLYFPLAMYGYAKVCEFMGGLGDYQLVEEFSHMNLFSVREEDLVVILPAGLEDRRSLELHSHLGRAGVRSLLLSFDQHMGKVEQAISYSIQLQYLALTLAQLAGLQQPAFLEKKKLLEISNKMIY